MNAIPANTYMSKVNNGNPKKWYEVCFKLPVKTPK